MLNTKSDKTQGLINKMQSLKDKSKLEIYKSTSIYYDEMNYRTQRGTFQLKKDLFSEST